MNLSDLDSVLGTLNIAAKVCMLAVLLWRRLYRPFPIFTALIFWDTITDPLLLWVIRTHSEWYNQSYFAVLAIDYLLEIAVLAEIAFNVLHAGKKSLPRSILYVVGALVLLVGASAFLLSVHANVPSSAHQSTIIVVNSTVAILRLVTFVLIAAFAQVLGLGWKHHVLQLASGLAFYSAIDLIVTTLQGRIYAGPDAAFRYHLLSEFLLAGYVCSLSYWCVTLAKKEAERKEFSPQMAQLLVTLSGSGKRHR